MKKISAKWKTVVRELKILTDEFLSSVESGEFYKMNFFQRLSRIRQIRRLFTKLLHGENPIPIRAVSVVASVLFIFLGNSCKKLIPFEPATYPALNFSSLVKNPFGLDISGATYFAFNAFGDLDGDGDFDCLTVEYYNNFRFFENIGASQNPAFTSPQLNPFNLNAGVSYYNYSPILTDIDGDGDLDLLTTGYAYNNITYDYDYGVIFRENTGTSSVPNFAPPAVNPFNMASLSNFWLWGISSGDLDDDGDFDLLFSAYDYNTGADGIFFLRNTGQAVSPSFPSIQTNPFSISLLADYNFFSLGDLDSDGDLDILASAGYTMVGSSYRPDVAYYENIGTKNSPLFSAGRKNPFGITAPAGLDSYIIIPLVVDIDNDGDLDVFLNALYSYDYEYNLFYYENVSGLVY